MLVCANGQNESLVPQRSEPYHADRPPIKRTMSLNSLGLPDIDFSMCELAQPGQPCQAYNYIKSAQPRVTRGKGNQRWG